jgi:hypothetical protein
MTRIAVLSELYLDLGPFVRPEVMADISTLPEVGVYGTARMVLTRPVHANLEN